MRPLMERVIELDRKLSLELHQKGIQVSRFCLKALEYSGDGTFWLPVNAGIWLAPVVKDSKLRSFLLNLFVAFVFDLILIGLIKSVVRRPRPIYNKGMTIILSVDHWSFPSGHSSRAFLIATTFLFNLPLWHSLTEGSALPYLVHEGSFRVISLASSQILLVPLISALVLTWAVATASSRVLLGRHYCFDVVVGSLLGVLEAVFAHTMLHIPTTSSEAFYESIQLIASNIYALMIKSFYF